MSVKKMVMSLRSNSTDVAKCMDEIKTELTNNDIHVKAGALCKLLYLHMLGYDSSWAAFPCIEVMSSPVLAHKRIAYLLVSLILKPDNEVLFLTPNLYKKMLTSKSEYEVSTALSSLSSIMTPEVSSVMLADILKLVNHSKAHIRKKAIVILFQMAVQESCQPKILFNALQDRLLDTDPSVVGTTISLILEHFHLTNTTSYLPLAPVMFELLLKTNNNWILMKVLKLLSSFLKAGSKGNSDENSILKFAIKLVSSVSKLLVKSTAKSLQYECLSSIILGFRFCSNEINSATSSSASNASVSLVIKHLKELVSSEDQNLKCLGLILLQELMLSYPSAVSKEQEIIASCLADSDEVIRTHAVKLMALMVNEDNLVTVVDFFLRNIKEAKGGYRDLLISYIIQVSKAQKYIRVRDFDWYLNTLLELSLIKGTQVGDLVAAQILDVVIRVESIRKYAVDTFSHVICNNKLEIIGNNECVKSYLWIVGEYASLLTNIDLPNLLSSILCNETIASCPSMTDSSLNAAFKILIKSLYSMFNNTDLSIDSEKALLMSQITNILSLFQNFIEPMCINENVEVKERALLSVSLSTSIMNRVIENESSKNTPLGEYLSMLQSVYKNVLLPVHPSAQSKVPLPSGLPQAMLPESCALLAKKKYAKVKFNIINSNDDEKEEIMNIKIKKKEEKYLKKKQPINKNRNDNTLISSALAIISSSSAIHRDKSRVNVIMDELLPEGEEGDEKKGDNGIIFNFGDSKNKEKKKKKKVRDSNSSNNNLASVA